MGADDAWGSDEIGVATSEECCAGRGADRAVRVKWIDRHSLRRQLIEVWRFQIGGSVAGELPVSEIVRENDEDVRLKRTVGTVGTEAQDKGEYGNKRAHEWLM